ncbi:uncharacterized protein Z520_11936 [Fonsecaea multimorphosa CBS 102226]|uniref:Uncharacterized protein n=1 Tax=Fonsecaea multimorphosa CBS 102226 TaxID=1442371 RepID=A0A0D2K7L3_9EURO|nr:uncharacterized protein Z520_11936 [Fonsecaea multimorphosa CBS 102226]KIX92328.1 hypothetical protein Z520_11936 [Fonsecaea multimorphosa CBS 102226]OAL17703.1 hypothetical protein AYO22_11359 [Fonsecaea multimorphosa]
MAPKGTKHKQKLLNAKKDRQLRQKMDDLDVADGAAQDTVADVTKPETTITTTKYPLLEKWEELEAAEAEEIAHKHKHTTGWLLPESLPVLVHVAAPNAGRFTREVQSDIELMNSIEAVKDLVKDSLIFELKRTNIDVTKTRFAGLMVYGPTTEFKPETIKGFTRGLFLQEAAYKKWWLSVSMSQRIPGDMVKIAVVLWHQDEASAKQVTLPNFWTDETARVLGNHLEKLEMPAWDLEIEKGCRAYSKMQEQVLEERVKRIEAETKASKEADLKKELQKQNEELTIQLGKLERRVKSLVNAIEANDMEKAARLVAQSQKSSKRKGKGKANDEGLIDEGEAAGDEEEEGVEDQDVEMADGGDDPNDSDYVEE